MKYKYYAEAITTASNEPVTKNWSTNHHGSPTDANAAKFIHNMQFSLDITNPGEKVIEVSVYETKTRKLLASAKASQ